MKKILIVGAVLVSLVSITILVVTGCGANAGTGSGTANATAQALTKQYLRSNITTSGTNAGTISGTITNLLTGAALAGVSVEAGGVSAVTNSSGNFTLTGVTAGTVSFSITAADYEDITVVCNASNISIALLPNNRSPQGTLTGIITDSNGSPVNGAYVFATSSTYFQESASYSITSTSGAYTLNASSGEVTISAYKSTQEGTVSRYLGSQYAKITLSANTTQEVNLQFSATTGAISGTFTNNTALTPEGVGAALIAGNNIHSLGGIGDTASNLTSFSFSVPPAQGSDQYLVIGGAGAYYWDVDYTSVAAGQTVTKNITIGNVIELTSPADGATVSATPTITWTDGTGNDFDLYVLDIYQPSNYSKRRRILTEAHSYALTTSEALSAGTYVCSIVGFNAAGYSSISSFNISEIVFDKLSQKVISITVE